jgi:hypothetical protein
MALSKYFHAFLAFLSSHSSAPSVFQAELNGVDASPQGNCITDVLYEGAPAGYMINVSNSEYT